MAICSKCGKEKAGKNNECRPCRAEYARERRKRPEYKARKNELRNKRRKEDPEYRNALNASLYKTVYGLTPETEKMILEKQNHRCPTCGREFSEKVKMHRDHDHNVGHFRGFLCHRCNLILGFAEATGDPERTLLNLLYRVKDNALFYHNGQRTYRQSDRRRKGSSVKLSIEQNTGQ